MSSDLVVSAGALPEGIIAAPNVSAGEAPTQVGPPVPRLIALEAALPRRPRKDPHRKARHFGPILAPLRHGNNCRPRAVFTEGGVHWTRSFRTSMMCSSLRPDGPLAF